jgi:hypothetical protein
VVLAAVAEDGRDWNTHLKSCRQTKTLCLPLLQRLMFEMRNWKAERNKVVVLAADAKD